MSDLANHDEEKFPRAFSTEDDDDEDYFEDHEDDSEATYEQQQPSLGPSVVVRKRNKLWFFLLLTLVGLLASIFVVPAGVRHFSQYLRPDNRKSIDITTEPEKQETPPIFDNFDRPETTSSTKQEEDEDKSEDKEDQQEDKDSETQSNNKQLFLQNISLSKSSATPASAESREKLSLDEDEQSARDNAAIEKKGDEMIARLTAASQEEQQVKPVVTNSKNTVSQNRYDTDQYTKTSATKLHLDPDLSLYQGTFIPCVLQTKIVSTIAGEVTCMISDDVYSHSGNIVLLEKGSKVFGTFNSGQLKNGENRIFIIWQKIRTPKDIEINIASNATDELGGSGVEGWVNNHFFKRFGAAVMVSTITKFLTTISENAANRAVKPSQTQVIKQKNSSPVDTQVTGIAHSILQKEMNIEPTLYRNQGDVVGIMLARDVDFSQVYSLRLKNGR